MSDCILEINNLTMQFGGVLAVDDFSMEVKKGMITALIGPNGAGKTTVFNCITGVYAPTNGSVSFLDKEIIRNHPKGKMEKLYEGKEKDKFKGPSISPTPDKITKLGMARTFQNIRLWKSMTVFENVLTAKHLLYKSGLFSSALRLNKKEEEKMEAETKELLKEMNLWDVKDEIAESLPYGIQRKLEIARALATSPKLLLLDEPAAGMNPQETLELTMFINEIKEKFNVSILLIEHHMDLVMKISDMIYVLDFGKSIAKGKPSEIQNNQKVIDAYLGVSEDA